MNRKEGELFDAPDFCLSKSTSEDFPLPDIMILDNIGHFEFHREETDDHLTLSSPETRQEGRFGFLFSLSPPLPEQYAYFKFRSL